MNDINGMLQEIVRQHGAGNLYQAEQLCRQVLAIDPNNPDAIHFFGVIAYNVGKNDIAKEYIGRAIELSPQTPGCYTNMGNVFQKEKNFTESIRWYKKAIEKDPQNKKAFSNLGVALTSLGELDSAVESFESALRLDPGYVEALTNLGEVYRAKGTYDQAMALCEKALAVSPTYPIAHWNRAFLWLLTGDLQKGWPEYEWRWQKPNNLQRKIDAGIVWEGQPFKGKTLFVYEEQGMGDTIQFIRYLPLLKQLGGQVIFEVLTPMIRLIETFKGFDRLWVGIKNIDTRPVDRFDYHVPLLSLPGLLNTRLENIPAQVPYLAADESLVQIWEKRLGRTDGLRVGINWAGHPGHSNDHNRSMPLSSFAFLKDIPGIRLFSLQKEKHEKWTDMDPDQIFDMDAGDQISDFADTAAVIENLDLVISVDTAVAHLAGAMGKKVWTLLPFSPDWRWMLDREDSPWYPTMRLFRQPGPGDWESVLKDIKKAFQNFSG